MIPRPGETRWESGDFFESLMRLEYTLGRVAAWVAALRAEADTKPGDFEYVKIAE